MILTVTLHRVTLHLVMSPSYPADRKKGEKKTNTAFNITFGFNSFGCLCLSDFTRRFLRGRFLKIGFRVLALVQLQLMKLQQRSVIQIKWLSSSWQSHVYFLPTLSSHSVCQLKGTEKPNLSKSDRPRHLSHPNALHVSMWPNKYVQCIYFILKLYLKGRGLYLDFRPYFKVLWVLV